jgi:parvulin-like peptidyl-prolyl isomerase
MKKPKVKVPTVPGIMKRPFRRAKPTEERVAEAFATVPRITNETVAEHREEVLSSARKYIYPLQHSKHRVVRISILLLITVIVAFFVYCGLALYKLQSTSSFIYGVTQVIPFPVAKAGPNWVSYESYLFELRRDMHYYQSQQQADFSTKDGKAQLVHLKQQALGQVITDAYVKQLAAKQHVSVSNNAVDDEVSLLRNQNRLGSSQRVFDNVLNEFWGWNESDFKRELKQQLLQQAVVAKLDTPTDQQASAVYQQLQKGADFGSLATQYSDDAATKATGGQYSFSVTTTNQTLAPQLTAELSKLKPGQFSPVINTGYSLEIVKVLSTNGPNIQAAHIQFNFKNISTYTRPLEAKYKPRQYIGV